MLQRVANQAPRRTFFRRPRRPEPATRPKSNTCLVPPYPARNAACATALRKCWQLVASGPPPIKRGTRPSLTDRGKNHPTGPMRTTSSTPRRVLCSLGALKPVRPARPASMVSPYPRSFTAPAIGAQCRPRRREPNQAPTVHSAFAPLCGGRGRSRCFDPAARSVMGETVGRSRRFVFPWKNQDKNVHPRNGPIKSSLKRGGPLNYRGPAGRACNTVGARGHAYAQTLPR